MKEKMRFFIVRPWCSQMMENTYHQYYRRDIRRTLENQLRPRGVINALLAWATSPQGDAYWRDIYCDDDTSHY